MKPERAQELYTEYAEGTLSPSLRLALEQHFAADPAAHADFDRFQQTLSLLDGAPARDVDVPIGFRARVLELAAEEQARRENTPVRRAFLSVTGFFSAAGPRRASGGVLAALAAAAVAGVLFFHANNTGGPNRSDMFPPSNNISNTSAPVPVLRGVSLSPGQDGNTYHAFNIHLPPSIPHATLTAYVVTATDQITDPAARLASATPALAQPQPLASDENMQLPVALLRAAPPGTTLNVLVAWTPDDASLPKGQQIIFTPAGEAAPQATASVSTEAGSVYDALQAIAAAYGVSVIADVPDPAPASITSTFTTGTPFQALKAVADAAGMSVHTLSANTYLVSAAK